MKPSFWTRSAFAALGMAVLALLLAGLDALLALGGFPPGVVHFALLLLLVFVLILLIFVFGLALFGFHR